MFLDLMYLFYMTFRVTQTASVKTIGSGEVHISMKACPVTFEDIRAVNLL